MKKYIVYEDRDILVAYKPAGIATQTARLGQQDMVSELKNYLSGQPQYRGKGEPYLGLVHRLDQPVAGILVFGKTKEAAASLSRQIAEGKLHKYYYAVIYGRKRELSVIICTRMERRICPVLWQRIFHRQKRQDFPIAV